MPVASVFSVGVVPRWEYDFEQPRELRWARGLPILPVLIPISSPTASVVVVDG